MQPIGYMRAPSGRRFAIYTPGERHTLLLLGWTDA